jgi:hypothetical protein
VTSFSTSFRVAGIHALMTGALAVAVVQSVSAADSKFWFVDVAAQTGLTSVLHAGRSGKDHLLDSAGSGVAFLDYDGDARLDIYLVNAWLLDGSKVVERGRNSLYRGRPDGTFEDVTERARVSGEGQWGSAISVADSDADGKPDLFVTNFGPNILYRNRGDGTFENVTAKVGLESPGWNTGAAFFDADSDGDLDLYVCSYIDCTLDEVLHAKRTLDWKGKAKVAFGPFGLEGAPDHFFRSERGAHFIDATAASGFADRGLAFGFAAQAADFDGDDDLDLYVANDSDGNYLYRNEGNGTFKEVGIMSGCSLDGNGRSQASMGVAVANVAGEGPLDVYVTNFSEDFSTLFRAMGGGLFEDASKETGIGPITYMPMSWGTAFGDFDNDGDLDLVEANGHIYPQIDAHPKIVGTYRQRNTLMENGGRDASPQFRDVTAQAGPGFQIVESSRGLATGDYDNDGDLDILISNLDAPPTLLRNDSAGGSWLTVTCVIPKGPSPPIGTTITLKAKGTVQRRDIASNGSFLSSHDPRAHFGLGSIAIVDEIDVRWPDGTHTAQRNIPARQFLTISKGK